MLRRGGSSSHAFLFAAAVGHFTISRNTNKPTAWEVLTENIPPKLCTNKFDCEYKRGARYASLLPCVRPRDLVSVLEQGCP